MDINPVLAAVINLAWLCGMLRKMNGQLKEWIDEKDLNGEEYLIDVVENIHDALVQTDQSFDDVAVEFDDLKNTAERLFECQQINAWEIKPCWNIYMELKKQVGNLHTEPLEYDLKDLEGQLTQLRKDIRSIKEEMYEVDDYLDLSESDKKWFIMLAEDISSKASAKSKPLYECASLTYTVYLRALDYCNCQKNTNEMLCLNELDGLNKAVVKYNDRCAPDD